MRRTLLVAAAALVAVAPSCSDLGAPAAVTVNGDDFTRDDLDQALDGIEEAENYPLLLASEAVEPEGEGGEGTFDSGFVAAYLNDEVYFTLVEERLTDEGVEVDEGDLDAVRADLEQRFAAEFDALPDDQADDVVRRIAALNALDAEVAPGYLDDHEEEFDTLCVSHILVATEDRSPAEARARAEGLAVDLEDGADFADLARESSDDTTSGEQGGQLGCTSRGAAAQGRFVEEFTDAAYGLEEGAVSEPVRTSFGYHLILLEERRATPASEVAPGAVQARLIEVLGESADVDVDPRYGRWANPLDGQPGKRVLPPEGPSGTTTTTVPPLG